MTAIAIAAMILLVGAALAVFLRNNVHRAWASIASQTVATALVVGRSLPILLGGGDLRVEVAWSYPVESITAHMDALGAFFLVWSLPMTLLGTIYAVGYLKPYFASRNAGVQFGLLNLTAFSFLMIYTLESAVAFLLGWEIAAVAAWLLVIWDYRNQKIRFAGFNYLVSTHIGFFVLVAAFMTMHSQTTSMDFDSFAAFLNTPGSLRDITFVLLVTSFGLKSAFFPFHTWLPRAHSAAPAHVSALMSGVIHKAGLFGLLRFTLLLRAPEPWMGWYVIAFSALSALLGVIYATSQRDLKRLLGYSSTENVGIAGIGFGVGYLGLCWHQPTLVVLGFGGGILHILNHAVFKCLLFYAAGAIYRATHTVDIERLGGLVRRMPWVAGLFLVGSVAIAALPPLNGFVSELVIYAGLLSAGAPSGIERALLIVTAALLGLVGGISALAMIRAFGITFLGTARDSTVHAGGDASGTMRFTMIVHTVAVLALGLFPALGLRLVEKPVALFMGLLGPGASLGLGQAYVYELVAPISHVALLFLGCLGGLVLLRRWLVRAPARRHVTWGCGYAEGNPRMQYTGASFTAQFAAVFESVLQFDRREKLPTSLFPEQSGHLHTHNVDTVEKRIFEAFGEGEELTTKFVPRLSEEPRFAFGLGLVVLAVLVFGALLPGGGAP